MDISLHPLDCGSLTAGRNMFEEGGGVEKIELPVNAWLIRHPDGTVVFDAGMSVDLSTPTPLLSDVSLFFEVGLSPSQLVGEQLRVHNVDPAAVDVVVVSHLHFDHVGGLAAMPNARLIINADEWQWGLDPDSVAAENLRPADYDLGHSIINPAAEYDIFGDGRIVCIPTPGHTPGHQSLRIRLETEEIVLCGDCAYFERTLYGGALPPFGDHDQQHASLETLRSMRSDGARLIPGHDAATIEALPTTLR